MYVFDLLDSLILHLFLLLCLLLISSSLPLPCSSSLPLPFSSSLSLSLALFLIFHSSNTNTHILTHTHTFLTPDLTHLPHLSLCSSMHISRILLHAACSNAYVLLALLFLPSLFCPLFFTFAPFLPHVIAPGCPCCLRPSSPRYLPHFFSCYMPPVAPAICPLLPLQSAHLLLHTICPSYPCYLPLHCIYRLPPFCSLPPLRSFFLLIFLLACS